MKIESIKVDRRRRQLTQDHPETYYPSPSPSLSLSATLTPSLGLPLLWPGDWFRAVGGVAGTVASVPGAMVGWVERRVGQYSGTYALTRLEKFLDREEHVAWFRLRENIGERAGPMVLRGCVIASPSNGTIANEPDYYYLWTRDAAFVLSALSLFSFLPASFLRPSLSVLSISRFLSSLCFS